MVMMMMMMMHLGLHVAVYESLLMTRCCADCRILRLRRLGRENALSLVANER
jgi:hypothetical protein